MLIFSFSWLALFWSLKVWFWQYSVNLWSSSTLSPTNGWLWRRSCFNIVDDQNRVNPFIEIESKNMRHLFVKMKMNWGPYEVECWAVLILSIHNHSFQTFCLKCLRLRPPILVEWPHFRNLKYENENKTKRTSSNTTKRNCQSQMARKKNLVFKRRKTEQNNPLLL